MKLNTRKYVKLLIIVGMIFTIIAGCNTGKDGSIEEMKNENTEPSKNNESEELDRLNKLEELDDEFVINLVTRAFDYHWRTRFNYNEDDEAIFTVDNVEYMYLSKEIDTREKLLTYLQEVYTEEVSQALFESYGLMERDGRLYHECSMLSTLMMWDESNIELIDESKENQTKTYEFHVPVFGDEDEVRLIEIVELKRVEGKGWRVNTVIDF
ncbi:MAG: hypothetical protein CVU88_04140 [Firmicutes bacterium HGW-Firmicutes-13]|nr:MAG: hypothetical protein CVU88_04140 [Firmicutes bacterium HGW-Firmicutes-13]